MWILKHRFIIKVSTRVSKSKFTFQDKSCKNRDKSQLKIELDFYPFKEESRYQTKFTRKNSHSHI